MFLQGNFQIKSPFNSTDCACPLPCNKVEYTGRISTAAFPNYDKNSTQKRGSRVEIKIYYDHLLTLTEEQIKKYTWPDLFGSAGGMIGLFTGASILTLLEFVELMAMCTWVSLKMLYSKTSLRSKNRSKCVAHVNKSFC
ncbi:acid-sensing ion channel 4-like [Physella acuta]|uniref:acid-sensing ion channel 4-like n=1 Tax=Physella acuta TaxID=109671 RepID=UPI0027DC135E|nr:acid-sensing ion channel 4-like [Physella acuta]